MNQPEGAAAKEAKIPELRLNSVGTILHTFPVELGARFLEQFSEQLYSSPQKAFEELISNGWDAGADYVDIRIPGDLTDPRATLSVLDNGESMDAEGLKRLWHIAHSAKRTYRVKHGRQMIGQFGIGKLATYVLAEKLTFICKATDGVIRRVTMNYEEIQDDNEDDTPKLVRELKLELYELSQEELNAAVAEISEGEETLRIISQGIPRPTEPLETSDFGGAVPEYTKPSGDTWTLVILSDLKPTGRELKSGVLRRMLQAALPIGSEMAISLNGQLLKSSKSDAPLMCSWTIGPDLGIDHLMLSASGEPIEDDQGIEDAEAGDPGLGESEGPSKERIDFRSVAEPFPHIDIPGIGSITGEVRLYRDRITGGISDERGPSNGFYVNVLGRVINQNDPSFGERNLSHAAWARFRMDVRVDGLNALLTTDRERFRSSRELRIVRALLRKVFNQARKFYDNDKNAVLPDGGDVLVKSLGVVSLNPLRNFVAESLRHQPPLPGLLDDSGVENREETLESWHANTSDHIANALREVKFEDLDDGSIAKFRISDSSIVVNKGHPFVTEHGRTKAGKELVREMAMINLLSDMYALDIGILPSQLQEVRDYRDRLLRVRSLENRSSGVLIAQILRKTQHDSDRSNLLEQAVTDALRYIGFDVTAIGKSGHPEGIAKAFPMPSKGSPSSEDRQPPMYSFTYDAKSSKHPKASTGNIKLDGIVEHRKRYKADYALVIAPGYQEGTISDRTDQQGVTLITADDLGRLLETTAEFGAIPLDKLQELFQYTDAKDTERWVGELPAWLRFKRTLTLDIYLEALRQLRGKIPDTLSASTISFICREQLQALSVTDAEVLAVTKGLEILIPGLIGVEGLDRVVVNANAERIADAIHIQLDALKTD